MKKNHKKNSYKNTQGLIDQRAVLVKHINVRLDKRTYDKLKARGGFISQNVRAIIKLNLENKNDNDQPGG